MDFSKYELSDELRATLKKDYEADVLGLKNKNTELIDRETKAKGDLESSKLETEQAKHDTAKALAEKDGSIADFKLALDNEKEAMTLLRHSFQEANDSRTLSDSVNEFSGALVDDAAGKMYMQSLYKNSVEVKDGAVVPIDTTKTMEDLKQSLVSDKANAKYIKADVGSGGGAAGSDGVDAVITTKNTKAESAKKSGDTLGFIQANLNK